MRGRSPTERTPNSATPQPPDYLCERKHRAPLSRIGANYFATQQRQRPTRDEDDHDDDDTGRLHTDVTHSSNARSATCSGAVLMSRFGADDLSLEPYGRSARLLCLS